MTFLPDLRVTSILSFPNTVSLASLDPVSSHFVQKLDSAPSQYTVTQMILSSLLQTVWGSEWSSHDNRTKSERLLQPSQESPGQLTAPFGTFIDFGTHRLPVKTPVITANCSEASGLLMKLRLFLP